MENNNREIKTELDLNEMDKASGGLSPVEEVLSTILEYSRFVDEKHKFIEGRKAGYDKSWAVYNVKERFKDPNVQKEALKEIDEIWSREY